MHRYEQMVFSSKLIPFFLSVTSSKSSSSSSSIMACFLFLLRPFFCFALSSCSSRSPVLRNKTIQMTLCATRFHVQFFPLLKLLIFTGREVVVAKVMFLQASVILSTGGGGGVSAPGSRHPPPRSKLRHTVNERPVRILLECILV